MKVCIEEDFPLYDNYLNKDFIRKYAKHKMLSQNEADLIKNQISASKYNIMERQNVKAYLIKEQAKDILLGDEDEN